MVYLNYFQYFNVALLMSLVFVTELLKLQVSIYE